MNNSFLEKPKPNAKRTFGLLDIKETFSTSIVRAIFLFRE